MIMFVSFNGNTMDVSSGAGSYYLSDAHEFPSVINGGSWMHFHIVKMYKDKEVKKNAKNICLSMCDVKIFLTFTSLNMVLL